MLTSKERETLVQIVRKREKVAKAKATERTAALLAEFELQMDRIYSFDEVDTWAKAKAEAEKAVEAAQRKIEAACDKLGIPQDFRPGLYFGWRGQGQNGWKQRRTELRRIAKAQLDAAEKAARASIEMASLVAQEGVMITAINGVMAKQFLDKLPTVEILMPPLKFADIESLFIERKKTAQGSYLPDYSVN